MTRLKINALANYAGGGFNLLLGAFFTGLFFNILGPANYAYIGIAQALQMILQVSDIGISASVNREMARSMAGPNRACEPLVILRTLGLANIAMVSMAALFLFLATPLLVSHWLSINPASWDASITSIHWTILLLACQAIANFYSAAISGLQKQFLLNILNTSFLGLRQFGTWALLLSSGPTIKTFFVSQTCFTFLQALVCLAITASMLRTPSKAPWFDRGVIARCWKFGMASAGTTITSLFVAQLDRLILVKFLSLEAFGVYSLVANIAAYLPRIAAPLTTALYPRLTQLVEAGNRLTLSSLYSSGCAYLGFIILPVFLCCAMMPESVLLIFTGLRNVPAEANLILILLSSAAMLSSCSSIPYLIQQAHGHQYFAFKMNLIYLFTYSPILYYCACRWGALGAASMALLLQVANFLSFPVYSAVKYFPKIGFSIYRHAFIHPLALAAVPFIVVYLISYSPPSRMICILYCGSAILLSYACIVFGFFKVFRDLFMSFTYNYSKTQP